MDGTISPADDWKVIPESVHSLLDEWGESAHLLPLSRELNMPPKAASGYLCIGKSGKHHNLSLTYSLHIDIGIEYTYMCVCMYGICNVYNMYIVLKNLKLIEEFHVHYGTKNFGPCFSERFESRLPK